ncbi:MAG: hypothetical protein ABIJ96_00015 [Elusimicrobiota bacterium]
MGLLSVGMLAAVATIVLFGPAIKSAFFGQPGRSGSVFTGKARANANSAEGDHALGGGSLDYFNDANKGALATPGAEGTEQDTEDSAESLDAEKLADELAASAAAEGADGEGAADTQRDGAGGGALLAKANLRKINSGITRGGAATSAQLKGTQLGDRRRKQRVSARGRITQSGGGRRGMTAVSAFDQLQHANKLSVGGKKLQPEMAHASESAAFGAAADGPSTLGEGTSQGSVGKGSSITPPTNKRFVDVNERRPPAVKKKVDVTPWQRFIDMARMLLLFADALLMGAAMLSMAGMKKPAALLAKGGMVVAMLVVGIGFNIAMSYGQTAQGGILMLAGGTAAGLAAIALTIGKHQPLLLALASVSSGLLALIDFSMRNRVM